MSEEDPSPAWTRTRPSATSPTRRPDCRSTRSSRRSTRRWAGPQAEAGDVLDPDYIARLTEDD